MRCNFCGADMPGRGVFCPRCGRKNEVPPESASTAKLRIAKSFSNGAAPAVLPKAAVPPAGKPAGALKETRKKMPRGLKLTLIVLGLLAALAVTLGALHLFGVIELPFLHKGGGTAEDGENEAQTIQDETLERPDPEEYMSGDGEIIGRTEATASSVARSEKAAARDFADRGFADYPIYACYDMDGVYNGEQEISESSSAVHPYYQTYYETAYGDLWLIMEVNGRFFAEPLSYNGSGEWDIPHMLSESVTIQNYDGSSNCFYEIKPDESRLFVKVVSRIDAKTLDALDIWEVNRK